MNPYLFICLLILPAIRVQASNEANLASERNDTADAILSQSSLPESYEESLLAELDSPEESTIWQNYILQKLDVLYLHPDIELEMRPVILARLWKGSRSPTPTFAGTSLITLLRLHEKQPAIVSAGKLAGRSQWVLDRSAYSNSDRLSALHVLAAIDQLKAAETAREWLQGPNTAPMLQQTALNVLGHAPRASDRTIIETFVNHPDLRLRVAAKSALSHD